MWHPPKPRFSMGRHSRRSPVEHDVFHSIENSVESKRGLPLEMMFDPNLHSPVLQLTVEGSDQSDEEEGSFNYENSAKQLLSPQYRISAEELLSSSRKSPSRDVSETMMQAVRLSKRALEDKIQRQKAENQAKQQEEANLKLELEQMTHVMRQQEALQQQAEETQRLRIKQEALERFYQMGVGPRMGSEQKRHDYCRHGICINSGSRGKRYNTNDSLHHSTAKKHSAQSKGSLNSEEVKKKSEFKDKRLHEALDSPFREGRMMHGVSWLAKANLSKFLPQDQRRLETHESNADFSLPGESEKQMPINIRQTNLPNMTEEKRITFGSREEKKTPMKETTSQNMFGDYLTGENAHEKQSFRTPSTKRKLFTDSIIKGPNEEYSVPLNQIVHSNEQTPSQIYATMRSTSSLNQQSEMRPYANPFTPHEYRAANPRMREHQQLPQKILMDEEFEQESTSSLNKSSRSIDQRERMQQDEGPKRAYQNDKSACLPNHCRISPACSTIMRLSMANPLETALGEERGLDGSVTYLERLGSSASRRRDVHD